jgi:hypothetical protein
LFINNFESDIVQWEPNIELINDCRRLSNSFNSRYCHNYVEIILLDYNTNANEKFSTNHMQINENGFNVKSGRLLVCGTYASKPLCTWRDKNNLNDVLEAFDGIGKAPSTPDTSLTYLKLDNGDYYFATSIDYAEQSMKADYLIDRSFGSSKQLRTDQYNSNWLNGKYLP